MAIKLPDDFRHMPPPMKHFFLTIFLATIPSAILVGAVSWKFIPGPLDWITSLVP